MNERAFYTLMAVIALGLGLIGLSNAKAEPAEQRWLLVTSACAEKDGSTGCNFLLRKYWAGNHRNLTPQTGEKTYEKRAVKMKPLTEAECRVLAIEEMWDLFKDAVETSKLLPSTPRVSFPRKSAMPEAPDEISAFAIMRAYATGEIMDLPEPSPARHGATREQIGAHDEVMGLWHGHAFAGLGKWRRYRKIVWDYAKGVPPRRLKRDYGVSRQRVHVLKTQAMNDMVSAMERAQKKEVDVLGIWGQKTSTLTQSV